MKRSPLRQKVQRALDANCNRVREGLRVAEDVARFLLDDPSLLKSLKSLRHQVTGAEKSLFASERLRRVSRDVAGDLGRGTKEGSEKRRGDAQDLLKANLKRAQEGLRSLEEFSKLLGHPAALRFKKIRYECYKVEETLA